jgi:hypothetical protein
MRSSSRLTVCPPYQLLNQSADSYEIQCCGHAIEGDLDAIIFNACCNNFKIADVQTPDANANLASLNVGP